LIVRFTDFLVHKSLFTKGFWLAAAEKLYDGAAAETANVIRALAIHNSTLWKRGVHADGQNRIVQCVIEVMRGHTKSIDAHDKLIQTRSHERDTAASRKRQVVMRKVKFTITLFQNVVTLLICDRTVINFWKNLIGLKSGTRLGMPILHNDQPHATHFVT